MNGDPDKTIQRKPEQGKGAGEAPALGEIGNYTLVEYIGRGGAGMVYRAVDPDKAEVAIKVLTATPMVPREDIERFMREADTSKKLRKHPNIITVYDTGHAGKDFYIVMELVPGGRTLKDVIGGGLSEKEALEYAVPVAQALEYAHQEGILHRDLKPANILINEFNKPLLADFGLAKMENSTQLTMTGTILGTPKYMSPEQCGMGDGEFTNQSDIYSFGLVVYELVTGTTPYPINSEMPLPEIFKTIMQKEPVPPRRIRRDISRNLEAVILRMLEKEKKLRYKDISQVRADLEACQKGMSVSVRRLTWAERWEKWLRRHSMPAFIVAIALAVVSSLYYFVVRPLLSEKNQAKQDADISAVAARHKAARLEEEIATLKNPGASARDDTSEGSKLLVKARESLASGKIDDAEMQFKSAEEWAGRNSHRGILLESKNSLARITLAKGQGLKAVGMFEESADAYGRETLNGQLALFEAGVSCWIQENEKDAFKFWEETGKVGGSDKEIDIRDLASYIKLLSRAMLSRGKNYGEEKTYQSVPQIFMGLGYWVLAQNTPDGKLKKGYLTEASKYKGIFIWIKEDANEDKK